MAKQHNFPAEAAYFIGIALLAFGTALMTAANLGLSMVVAPAYLIHAKLSLLFPAVTFGRAEYIMQAFLLVGLCIALRKFLPYFLFSFLTALLYGWMLDLFILLVDPGPLTIPWRILLFAVGAAMCALGVSFVLHTYIAPEVYELLVKEVSRAKGLPSSRVKTIYDCSSLAVSVVLSFVFFGFGHFVGVSWGTLLYALCAGTMVGLYNRALEHCFTFQAAFPAFEKFFLSPSDSTKDC